MLSIIYIVGSSSGLCRLALGRNKNPSLFERRPGGTQTLVQRMNMKIVSGVKR